MSSPLTRRRIAALLLAGTLGVGVAACGGSDSAGSAGKAEVGEGATLESTTTTAPAATSTAVTEATTTTAPAAVGDPAAEGAAQRLYDAWKAGDKVAAAQVADPAAIDGMWLTPPGDYALYNRCDSGEFDFGGCLFRGDTGTIQIDLEKRGGNWVVSTVFYADL